MLIINKVSKFTLKVKYFNGLTDVINCVYPLRMG